MARWRVTYLPAPPADPSRPVSLTIDDPQSASIAALVERLGSGSLGAEWSQGRVIRSIEWAGPLESHRSRRVIEAVAVAAVFVCLAVVLSLFWIFPIGGTVATQHPWSGTAYTGAVCGEGCFSQPLEENFSNGSVVAGTWTAAQPVVLFIATSAGHLCPGGTPSSYGTNGGCSEPGLASGAFGFSAVGGAVYFTFGSQSPENVSVSGTWS